MNERKQKRLFINEKDEVIELPTCPLESVRVVCFRCGSQHFSLDAAQHHQQQFIPGRCDECGFTMGERIEVKEKSK